jgi:HEXXH motif-containing protein
VALLSAVREAMARDPGAVWSAVRRPTIGALIRYARFAGRAAQVLRELVATVSIELALAGALERTVRVPAPPRVIGLGSRQVWALPAGTIACGPDGVFVEGRPLGEFVVAAGFLAIEDGLVLACVDNNPLAAVEAHPDKQGNAIDLGGRAAEAWVAALREALAIIKDLHAGAGGGDGGGAAAGGAGRVHEQRHLSASYQEAIGTVYLSLHPNPMTMVEALIHEFSHNKLNALFELDAVLENAFSPLYPSPVRPDPRPLHGVLLAVHAFLPVARLYADMLAAGDPRAADPGFIRQVRGDRGGEPRGGGGAAGARAGDEGRGFAAGGDRSVWIDPSRAS